MAFPFLAVMAATSAAGKLSGLMGQSKQRRQIRGTITDLQAMKKLTGGLNRQAYMRAMNLINQHPDNPQAWDAAASMYEADRRANVQRDSDITRSIAELRSQMPGKVSGIDALLAVGSSVGEAAVFDKAFGLDKPQGGGEFMKYLFGRKPAAGVPAFNSRSRLGMWPTNDTYIDPNDMWRFQ